MFDHVTRFYRQSTIQVTQAGLKIGLAEWNHIHQSM